MRTQEPVRRHATPSPSPHQGNIMPRSTPDPKTSPGHITPGSTLTSSSHQGVHDAQAP